jgi:hypothetical protein
VKRVAIIGSGPAGLFCADRLAESCEVTIFEAGSPIEERICPETGCSTCPTCHILEGEGGAGGLSDGKNTYSLLRGTQMEDIFDEKDAQWLEYIDDMMVRHAGDGVWYDPVDKPPEAFERSPLEFTSYPLRHVGSDGIRKFVKGFSADIQKRGVVLGFDGAEVLFKDGLADVRDLNKLDPGEYDIVVIAAGLQGIPWVERLMSTVSTLKSGPAGFGIRLEVDSRAVAELHEKFYDYKIVYKHESGLIVRSFCCNQNGLVLNERHTDLGIINVNGHSYLDPSKRTRSSNLAIIVKIPESFTPDPQKFVRDISRHINLCAGNNTAYEPLIEFMEGWRANPEEFVDKYMTNPQSEYARIHECLEDINPHLLDAFRDYLTNLAKAVPLIMSPTSIIYAPEMKYYGRRMNVTKKWKSMDIENLYIIGSCTGYLDSFVAASLSGIVAAKDIKKGGDICHHV